MKIQLKRKKLHNTKLHKNIIYYNSMPLLKSYRVNDMVWHDSLTLILSDDLKKCIPDVHITINGHFQTASSKTTESIIIFILWKMTGSSIF